MPRLGNTLENLAAHRRRWRELVAGMSARMPHPGLPGAMGAALRGATSPGAAGTVDAGRLFEVTDFGANPGALRMFTYAPATLPPSPGLVVVLHGCSQAAAGYDVGTGWSSLAERYGFVVLAPQQTPANNPKTCFNWFLPGDTARGHGEAASIRAMVARAVADHGIDPARIFVTGLSAGGAMTAVMLATYPDVFAAGAIIAGLPYGAAGNVQEAFESMFQGRARTSEDWGARVRAASPHRGPWPRVSVWHGSADTVVKPSNAGEIVKQWANVHGIDPAIGRTDTVDGYPHEVWKNAAGESVIESYTITGLGHGTPLATGAAATGSEEVWGAAGPFLLEAGISSSHHIAEFFGLTGARRTAEATKPAATRPAVHETVSARAPVAPTPTRAATSDTAREREPRPEAASPRPGHFDVGAVITKALRAAGLMKSDA